ncbi:MAG: hypothetical protein AB7O04_13265, partial [Hyphomonadaceae bacterium]
MKSNFSSPMLRPLTADGGFLFVERRIVVGVEVVVGAEKLQRRILEGAERCDFRRLPHPHGDWLVIELSVERLEHGEPVFDTLRVFIAQRVLGRVRARSEE